MADINLSKAVRSNLSSLQNTATLMAKTQDRLSTGNKVNSALDNPTNFFTASSLNSRAGDLNNLMDSMANGIKTIEAANNGLTSITKTLESMQSTLRQARQDKSFQTESFSVALGNTLTGSEKMSISGGQFDTAAQNIDLTKVEYRATRTGTAFGTANALAADAEITINGKNIKLANGTTSEEAVKAINDAGAGVKAELVTDVDGATAGDQNGIKLTSTSTGSNILVEGATAALGLTNATTSKVAATQTGTEYTAPAAATSLTINDTKIEIAAGATAQQAMEAINAAGAGVKAEVIADVDSGTAGNQAGLRLTQIDTNSALRIGTSALGFTASSTDPTGAESTRVTKTVNDLVSEISNNAVFDGKVRATNDNGKLRIENLSTKEMDIKGVNTNGTLDGISSASKKINGNDVRTDLATQYNELRDQLDKMSDDASFNGINLLRGDNLKITFNENGTSSVDIQTKGAKSVNASNLKIETSLESADLDSDAGIDKFLDQIKGALNAVRSQASAFGSNLSIVQNRQDFTKNMINTLETGAGNLTLADMNQEAANMMALQTRQSLASSTLSMANQADQGVLQLLR
ncbi:flagellin N-terminal helical domain-containing protein [Devosia sp. A449]